MASYKSNIAEAKFAIEAAKSRALEAVGVFIEGEAISRCPVGQYDDGRVGGNLRNSITHKTEKNKVIVGATAKYAVYIEKGTGIYAKDGKGRKTPWVFVINERTKKMVRTKGQRPKPYLVPAVEHNISKIKRLFQEHMKL